MKFCHIHLLLFFLLSCVPFATAQKGVEPPGEPSEKVKRKHAAYASVQDIEGLPRVLLIGDSISLGYTAEVRKLLKGKANVHRVPGNAGHTGMGIDSLPKWLDGKNGQWDLIHFNWGLWDLCYRNPKSKNQGNRDKVNGTLTHTPEVYAANLEIIVQSLEKTGATLIFATTTPVPAGELGRKVGDDQIYNRAALAVMKKHGVLTNDLHAVMEGRMEKFGKKAGDVHFTAEGSELLAKKVATAISVALASAK